jgi:aspartate/methionine/tyrosine aminotransferase
VVNPDRELILTPGTQAGLFLALSSLIEPGDRVAVVEPDYFANRRILRYLGAELVPIELAYQDPARRATIDLDQLRSAVQQGVRTVCLSNPNNPTGCVYEPTTIEQIADICREAGAFVVVDELYCRLIYPGIQYAHLRAMPGMSEHCVALLGPSKTESLSGYRVGAAVGPDWLIDRMESILSIVSLRAPGYSQAVLRGWLTESPNWLQNRIAAHGIIRDRTVDQLRELEGIDVRITEGGSYLFPRLPRLAVSIAQFLDELRQVDGVIVTPGELFGPRCDQSFRINFSQHELATEEAIHRIVRRARRYLV